MGGSWRGKPQSQRGWWGGGNLCGGVDTSVILSELPTYFRLCWCKRSSMICTTKHSFLLKPHKHYAASLVKNQSLNQFFYLHLLLHYWLLYQSFNHHENENFLFLNTVIIIFCLIFSLNIPHSNQNPSFFYVERSLSISSKFTFRRHFTIS